MTDYSGKKHIISALMRRYTDRVPVTVQIGPYCSRLTDYSVKEILQDAKKSAEAHLAFYDRFAPDSVIIYNDIYLEVEALGCELEFPMDSTEDRIDHFFNFSRQYDTGSSLCHHCENTDRSFFRHRVHGQAGLVLFMRN